MFACTASAAEPVRVSLTGKRAAPVAGRAWTVRLAVRPLSYAGTVRVSAVGPGRVRVRATGRRGSYRARLVFPKAGQWRISAQAGGATSRLGSVRVRRPPARPVVFVQPTSIDLEPAGTLLLVENNPGRVLRVNPATGRVSVLVPSIARPYAVVRAPSGSVYVSVGNQLQRLNGERAADDRGRGARRNRDRADRRRPERRRLLLDRDADLPAHRRFRAAHPDRRHRGGRWRR